jgi:glycosyltransferase involved in cell wall biosynthesis
LLHPTYYDSCANVVLEAMSSGLPVVASDRCGANELISDGRSGFELPVTGRAGKVIAAWQERILALGNDKALRERVGHEARRAMLENGFDSYVAKFEALLQRAREVKAAG